ncbi:UNVERIFIED_ORG: GNAT family N-acetyltransferase [Roseateles sp. XES5]|nr:GNAT family protein [Roseateles sp. XES5]
MSLVWGGPRAAAINAALAGFVAQRLGKGFERGFGPCATLGDVERDTIRAAVVFHNWQPEEGVIEMSAASDSKRWLTRPMLKAMFGFCFAECGCQLAILRVSERNETMCRIARRFGFAETRIPRLRGRDEAEIIFTLSDDQWNAHRANERNA